MTTPLITDHLDSVREHLSAFELPPAWSITINTSALGPTVTVQLAGDEDLVSISRALLAWADTLTQASAEAWRTHDGTSVHLSVTGQLAESTSLRVYDAVAAAGYPHGDALAAGETTTLALSVVRAWATLGEVVA